MASNPYVSFVDFANSLITSLCFKQKKNIIAISAFVEKSCGIVVHTKNEHPTVRILMLIVGEKQKHTSRPLVS